MQGILKAAAESEEVKNAALKAAPAALNVAKAAASSQEVRDAAKGAGSHLMKASSSNATADDKAAAASATAGIFAAMGRSSEVHSAVGDAAKDPNVQNLAKTAANDPGVQKAAMEGVMSDPAGTMDAARMAYQVQQGQNPIAPPPGPPPPSSTPVAPPAGPPPPTSGIVPPPGPPPGASVGVAPPPGPPPTAVAPAVAPPPGPPPPAAVAPPPGPPPTGGIHPPPTPPPNTQTVGVLAEKPKPSAPPLPAVIPNAPAVKPRSGSQRALSFTQQQTQARTSRPLSNAPPGAEIPSDVQGARTSIADMLDNTNIAEEDFSCFVREAGSEGEGTSKYTIYTVQMKTTLPYFLKAQCTVSRRYRHFEWLWLNLSEKFPGFIIPPLPKKKMLGRFDANFVLERQRGLQNFLNRVGRHKGLVKHEDFKLFLQGQPDEFAVKFAEDEKRRSELDAKVSKVKTSFMSKFMSSKPAQPGEVDAQFREVETSNAALQKLLVKCEDQSKKLFKNMADHAEEVSQVGGQFATIGRTELDKAGKIAEFGGLRLEEMGTMYQQLSSKLSTEFTEEVSYYVEVTESIKSVIKARSLNFTELKDASDDLEKKGVKSRKMSVGSGGEGKKLEAKKEVEKAEDKVNKLKERMEHITSNIKEEMERFESEKESDLLKLVYQFAKANRDFNDRALHHWKRIEQDLESYELS